MRRQYDNVCRALKQHIIRWEGTGMRGSRAKIGTSLGAVQKCLVPGYKLGYETVPVQAAATQHLSQMQ